MLKRWCSGVLLVAFVGFSVATASGSTATSYGEALSGVNVVRISQLLNEPEKYVDERVRVAGLVDDVCPMRGCWIDILEGDSRETIRFKVTDGVIVFPVEAKGQEVVAEGVLRKHEMSKRRATSWMRHLAEEKGEPFDESSVTGPMTFYQIEGVGAELQP